MNETKPKPLDARARRSREALKTGMLELVDLMPFDQITIRDLARTAKVTPPTFYRNYASKEEILGEIAAEEMKQLTHRMWSLLDLRDTRASASTICDYVEEHRKLWKTLLTTSATSYMRETWVEACKDLANRRARFNPDLPMDMAAAVVVSAMIEILAWWLRQPEDYPKEYVTQFIDRLIMTPTIGPDVFVLDKGQSRKGTRNTRAAD